MDENLAWSTWGVFQLFVQRHNQNTVAHLRRSFSGVNYFCKNLHLRCSTGFWIHCNLPKSKSLGQHYTKSRHVSKKAAVSMGLLADQISLKLIFKIFLVDFGRDISCYKSMFLSKAPTACHKKMWNSICFHCVSICISSKSVSQVFKILFHKLETVIFLSFVVSFIMSNICK